MSFQSVSRAKPAMPEPFCATPADCIRLHAHRAPNGTGNIVVIWIGKDIATEIGLSERRHMVDLMIDDEGAHRRLAICKKDGAEFYATRRGRSHCITLDAMTSSQLFRAGSVQEMIMPDLINPDGQVVFAVPDGWRA